MTARIDPARSQRGRTGHSRALANSVHVRRCSYRRDWQALNGAGEIVATAKSRAALEEFFGADFEIRLAS